MDDLTIKIEKRFENVSKSKTFCHIRDLFDLKNKTVLDLGCSYGEFLTHFGPDSVGVTITKEEAEYGNGRRLDVRYGNIESDSIILEGIFDVIFANNIFEHLFSPHKFLCKIKKYLKKDGVLILGVPCVPKILSFLRINKFRGSLASAHINFFTKETLVLTVEKAGWNVKLIRGFHFSNEFIDSLFNPIYPHFYIVASNNPSFDYSKKRMKELVGYTD